MKNFRCDHSIAYFRPLPRTHPQNQRVQTHSRGRAGCSGHNENFTIILFWSYFLFCSIYTTAPRATHAYKLMAK